VAVGIPGYVLPTDQTASLFLKSPSPVKSFTTSPAGALTVTPDGTGKGWARYAVRAQGWGPARLSVTYADGQVQTISYDITKPLDQVAADLGHFATTSQWFEGKGDPFHRSPAILTYDREENRLLTQDGRVWVAGMSDEGGAGSWVAAMVKQLDNPNAEEVAKLERLVNETVLGHLQVAEGNMRVPSARACSITIPRSSPTITTRRSTGIAGHHGRRRIRGHRALLQLSPCGDRPLGAVPSGPQ
jgi:hypothetical protein